MKEFTLTREHIKLSKEFVWEWSNYSGLGAPTVDPKRPYGDSSIPESIAKIIDLDFTEIASGERVLTAKQEDYCIKLHKEMETALEVILTSGSFKTGTYVLDEDRHVWKRVLTNK